MKKVVLGYVLIIAVSIFGQQPFTYEKEDARFCLAVYLIDEQDSYSHYIRLFEEDFESIVYFKKGDTLCELTRCNYQKIKQNYRTGHLKELKRIYRKDTLTFAQEDNDAYGFYIPIDQYSFRMAEVNVLFQKPIVNNIFYENKVTAFLKFKPILAPLLTSDYVEPWYVEPVSKKNLISSPCREAQNFDCLCAALQFGTTNQKETAQQIASYLINRFTYGYGDTSQYHPLGLLTGTQNLAVCAGYSQMYELLLQKANITAKYVDGAVRIELNDIFYSGHSHAWNELEIDGKRLCSDVTWATDQSSDWLLNSEENFFISHYRDPTGDSLWDKSYKRSMYEFMHQPMVRDPDKNAIEHLQYLKNGMPMQFMEDEFTVRFSKSLPVSEVRFYELSYPFVQFESQKAEVTQLHLSDGKGVKYEKAAKAVSFTLKDQFTRVSLDVKGIGTLDYCVFNGSQTDFYHFLIDHIDAKSPYSVAMAFLACAKLDDIHVFNKLKPFLENPKLSFKTFQKQAKTFATADFQFALFNATRHFGDFSGFSFEYSNDPREPRIYLGCSDDQLTYRFSGFNIDTWQLRKK